MPYVTQEELDRKKRYAEHLRGKPMTRGNRNTDVFSGLAYMLNQYNAGNAEREAAKLAQQNEELQGNEMSGLINALSVGESGEPAPDYSDMAITEGMDLAMLEGAQENAISTPGLNDFSATHPEVKKIQLAEMLRRIGAEEKQGYEMEQISEKGNQTRLAEALRPEVVPDGADLTSRTGTQLYSNDKTFSPSSLNYPDGKIKTVVDESVLAEDGTQRVRQVAVFENGARIDLKDLPSSQIASGGQGSPLAAAIQNFELPATSTTGAEALTDLPYETGEQAKAAQQTKEAKTNMSRLTEDMMNSIFGMREEGASVSTQNNTTTNLKNYVRQNVSIADKASGSKVGQYRQQMDTIKPMMMNMVRKATEQGARSLDSNRELDFYLALFTDPDMTIEAQMAAMYRLNDLMGNNEIKLHPRLQPYLDELNREWTQTSDEFNRKVVALAKKKGYTIDEVKRQFEEMKRIQKAGGFGEQ